MVWALPSEPRGGHGLSAARFPFDAQLRVNPTLVCHEADQGFGWRRVQAIDHENPGRGWVTPNGTRNMAHNIRCRPGRPHGRRQDVPGRDLNSGDPCLRARPTIGKVDALHQAWLQRTCGMRAFIGLNAGLLIGAHDRPPVVVSVGCLLLQRAAGLDVCVNLLGVFGAVVMAPRA
jgi:hypothetical protein